MRSEESEECVGYSLLSFFRETTQETLSRQAWEVELGKGLTAEPWATERSVSSATEP